MTTGQFGSPLSWAVAASRRHPGVGLVALLLAVMAAVLLWPAASGPAQPLGAASTGAGSEARAMEGGDAGSAPPSRPVSTPPTTAMTAPEVGTEATAPEEVTGFDVPAVEVVDGEPRPTMRTDSVLVRFRQGAAVAEALDELGFVDEGAVGATSFRRVGIREADPHAAGAVLRDHPAVDVVEPNFIPYPASTAVDGAHGAIAAAAVQSVTPDDPEYTERQRTYMETIGAPEAWARRATDPDAQATIAIIDSGVDLDHPDLEGQLVDGYAADNPGAAPTDMHPNGHGTQSAGVAAAATDNGQGVAGVGWGARIMPVRIHGGGTDAVADGLQWAVDNGATVVNASIAVQQTQALAEALTHAADADVVMVASGGNVGRNSLAWPAGHPDVLAVGWTTHDGDVVGSSHWHDDLDLVAPGVGLWTTIPDGGYAGFGGSSASAPVVAGAAALLRAARPDLDAGEVGERLRRTAQDRGPVGVDRYYGHGLLDVGAALGAPPQPALPREPRDALEPNGTPEQAVTVEDGVAWAALAPSGDVDWFAVDVSEPGFLTWTVEPPAPQGGALMRPRLDAYAPDLGRLGSRHRHEYRAEELTVAVTGNGPHYLRVRSSGPSPSGGPYRVRAEVSDDPPAPPALAVAEALPDTASSEVVAVGDVTGSGRADIATVTTTGTGGTSHSLVVFEQQADGSSAPPSTIGVDVAGAVDLAVGELGGEPTVALATERRVTLYRWTGGGLAEHEELSLPASVGEVEIAAVDDGSATLVTSTTDGVHLVASDGAGGVNRTPVYTRRLTGLSAADLDGDGRVDLAGFDTAAERAVAARQQDDGSFALATSAPLPFQFTPITAAAGDVTGDGTAEILVAQVDGLRVLEVAGDGTTAAPVTHGLSRVPHAVATGDLTADGRDEVVVTYSSREVGVLVADGDDLAERGFDGLPGEGGLFPRNVVVADVDGNDSADVVYADPDNGVVLLRQLPLGAPLRSGPAWVRAASPDAHTSGVASDVEPTLRFARALDPASVGAATVRLRDGRTAQPVEATVDYDAASRTVTVRPVAPLDEDAPYRLFVTGVMDTDGVTMTDPFEVHFAVGAYREPETTGTLAGRVLDAAEGTSIPGAEVVLLHGGDEVAATVSAADGGYAFADLEAGSYDLRGAAVGYTATQLRVNVAAGGSTTIDLWLDPEPGDDPPAGAGCHEGLAPSAGFADTVGSLHERNIDCVVWYEIARGVSSSAYAPANNVTRAQMATFIANLIDEAGAPLPAAGSQFDDVAGNPHEANINRLAAAGVVRGTGGGSYSPERVVNRAQMASFLVAAYEYVVGEALPDAPREFTDIEGNPHADNIDKAAAAEFARGTGGGTYSPGTDVRRDQMASFLANVLERLAADGHVSPPGE